MSSSDIAVSVRGLGKSYKIRHNATKHTTLAEAITDRLRDPLARSIHETFWALKDVSFNIAKGEVVGIIGRNGAGKSTLLKLLSRITAPTIGEIDLYGRVGSLLEVGTGFHPELTGRENIYLNGAILGMSHAETRNQFDAIVAFSGVERFLDTPVKRYSSGMYVRLAFAVAAHLNPEILIVDEVLAVGDAEFQNKCMGKMKDVAGHGRTVLFVSHNISAIERLCKRVILLDKGTIAGDSADVENVVCQYINGGPQAFSAAQGVWRNTTNLFGDRAFQPMRFSLTDADETPLHAPMRSDDPAWVIVDGNVHSSDSALNLGYALYSAHGELLYWSCLWDSVKTPGRMEPGPFRCRSRLPRHLLNEGSYRIEFIAGLHNREWICEPEVNAPSIAFQVYGGLSESALWISKRPGLLAPVLGWEITSHQCRTPSRI